MRVKYHLSTGRPGEVLSHLRRRVAAFASTVECLKIGRTNAPEARATRADYAEYDEMRVIYRTSSIAHADEVERGLIDHFEDADNLRGGGGGPAGNPPHYVYLVWNGRWRRRPGRVGGRRR